MRRRTYISILYSVRREVPQNECIFFPLRFLADGDTAPAFLRGGFGAGTVFVSDNMEQDAPAQSALRRSLCDSVDSSSLGDPGV